MRNFFAKAVGAASIIFLIGCEQEAAPLAVELLIHNGVVFTAEENDPLYSAVVVDDGKILAVGGEELQKEFLPDDKIDLQGRLLVPGFNDTHIHVWGDIKNYIDLEGVPSLEELKRRVANKAAELGPGEWITGYGWADYVMAEGQSPTRNMLDEVAPENPVYLEKNGAHSAVVNSLAFTRSGIDESTPDPEGGRLGRDADGRLNGLIEERMDVVNQHVQAGSVDEVVDSLEQKLRGLLELGITSITDATLLADPTPPVDVYKYHWKPVYERAAAELPRATLQMKFEVPSGDVDALRAAMKEFGLKNGDGDDRFKMGPLKLYIDGAFSGNSAWTLDSYKSKPNYFGKPKMPIEDFYAIAKAAHAEGWQLGIHAIGNRGIKEAVDVLARILDESPRSDHRHYLNHFSVMPPDKTMKKMAAYGIGISQQPNFAYAAEGAYTQHLWGRLLAQNNGLATPINHGVLLAISSDNIPIGPMTGLYSAVTRKGVSGKVYGPEERISMEQAIRAYTLNAAKLHFDEDVKGSITPGKYADLVVLSQNLLEIDPEKILETKVDLTMIGGQVLYERP